MSAASTSSTHGTDSETLIRAALESSDSCGEDLEYNADFLALQQAAVGKDEQQFGSTIIPAEPPDWNQVDKLSLALLTRTRDMRVLALRAQARAELAGLPGYAQVLEQAAGILERCWLTVHPRLQIDGEEDPMPRMNALAALADMQGAGSSARAAAVLRGEHGSASLRDAEAMLDGSRPDNPQYPAGRERLAEELKEAYAQSQPEISAAITALHALERIRDLVAERLGPAWAPDFSGMERSLKIVRMASGADTQADAGPAAAHAQAHAGLPPNGGWAGAQAANAGSGAFWRAVHLRTREDAAAMLDKVCRYFETHEPSHPAPILIQRVQQLIPLDFYEIVKNVAPQGLEQIELLKARPTHS